MLVVYFRNISAWQNLIQISKGHGLRQTFLARALMLVVYFRNISAIFDNKQRKD